MALYMNYIVVIDYLYSIYSVLTRKRQPSSKLQQKLESAEFISMVGSLKWQGMNVKCTKKNSH